MNKIVTVSDNLLATGDDDGVVKLWDPRVGSGTSTSGGGSSGGGGAAVKSWQWHEDFVSGLCYREDQSTLLSIAGEMHCIAYCILILLLLLLLLLDCLPPCIHTHYTYSHVCMYMYVYTCLLAY